MNFSNTKSLTIPEGNVTKISHGNVVLWQKITSRIPAEYQEVEWVGRETNAALTYIDLGFAFDTKATIYIGFLKHFTSSQFFGAAESSGKYRCMITDNSTQIIAYGSTESSYTTAAIPAVSAGGYMDLKYTLDANMLEIEDLATGSYDYNNKVVPYRMTSNLALFAQYYNGNYRTSGGFGFTYFKYYDKTDTLICDLVPCYRKSDGEIGMYDIVRKMFLVNQGAAALIKGSDV